MITIINLLKMIFCFVFLEICCFKEYIFYNFMTIFILSSILWEYGYYLSFSNVFFSAFFIAYNFFMAKDTYICLALLCSLTSGILIEQNFLHYVYFYERVISNQIEYAIFKCVAPVWHRRVSIRDTLTHLLSDLWKAQLNKKVLCLHLFFARGKSSTYLALFAQIYLFSNSFVTYIRMALFATLSGLSYAIQKFPRHGEAVDTKGGSYDERFSECFISQSVATVSSRDYFVLFSR